jgi:hypothetical protein
MTTACLRRQRPGARVCAAVPAPARYHTSSIRGPGGAVRARRTHTSPSACPAAYRAARPVAARAGRHGATTCRRLSLRDRPLPPCLVVAALSSGLRAVGACRGAGAGAGREAGSSFDSRPPLVCLVYSRAGPTTPALDSASLTAHSSQPSDTASSCFSCSCSARRPCGIGL